MAASPFHTATIENRRKKIFLWGPSGSGKTTLALQFPNPVVMDLEGGTALYGTSFKFDVLNATTADDVMGGVDWLLKNEHPYSTLVIDPLTVYWEALQSKYSEIFLARNKQSKGFKFDFYDFQPKDWMTIKAEIKELYRKLIRLDMNVIITAHQKSQYADGDFMKKIGETFDGEKKSDYFFDIVLRLYRSSAGAFMAESMKDRSNTLPKEPFAINYKTLEAAFGSDLGRVAEPVRLATEDQRTAIRDHINRLGITQDGLNRALARYGANTIAELTEADAVTVIATLEKKNPKPATQEEHADAAV